GVHCYLLSFPTRRSSDLGYSWMFRGLPELVVLLFCFLALPQMGLRLTPIQSAVIGLALVASAYEYEILRGALTAVPAQQYEASRSEEHTSELQSRENLVC